MAEAGLSFLLDNVQSLAVRQVDLYRNAESEFKLLEHELGQMKAILEDAARNPREEECFKAWEKRVREVVYDAEDTIDSWFTGGGNKISSYLGFTTSIGDQVRTLREKTVKPAFEKSVSDFNNLPMSETRGRGVDDVRDRRNKAPRNENVVGFEDEIDTLVKYIYQDADKLDVISIIGMPGLGKTTVAWKIYNHPRIQHDFPIRIWVYVSQDFNKKDLLLTIMKKFKMQDLSAKSEDELFVMVKKELETRKFLLCMDDVWNVKTWNQIKEFLPMNNYNGKVLITSRYIKVGKISNDKRDPHQLRFLDADESLELLQIEVFGKPCDFSKTLESMCRLIATQCGGLPLAIIVIGGVLAERRSPSQGDDVTEAEWQKVSDSVRTYLNQGDDEKRMHKFISLSYTALPYHLRNPFLYMGMFPEDAEIPAWKLRQMWIGEGFILNKPTKSLEEVAHENLKDLIDRNLVQVDTIKPNGEVKTCRLHDTIREFCINEAAENQNLFHEISKSKKGIYEPSTHVIQSSRRLCIHSNVGDILSKYLQKQKAPKARALLFFSKESLTLDPKDIPTIINASNMLRVLEISNNIKFPKFPLKVSQLVHLRYISLSGDQFKILPDISNLWNLQTIMVVTLQRTLEVKANLWKMVQLRHFKTKASVILKTVKGGRVDTLQTLGRLSPESCTDDVFEKAKNLNTLGIRGDLNKLFSSRSFVGLSLLEKLKLFHDVSPVPANENPWKIFPQVDKFPPHLKSLTLSKTYLDWDNMTNVGRLHTLEMLKLKENAFQGNRWSRADSGGFVRLRFLHIERTDLVIWEAAPGSFPKLRNLVLKNCEKLEAVPSQVGDNLDMMYLERVKKCIATSARNVEAKKNEGSRIAKFKLFIRPGCDM